VIGRVIGYFIHLNSGSGHAMGIAGGFAVLLLASGCGSSTSSPSASSSPGSSSFSSYLSCLRQHGVNVPTARPTSGSGGSGGGFGGFGGFGGTASSTVEKARQACASLRPTGGFGGFGGGFAAAFQAFRSCMASHGETIPTTRPTPPPASAPSPGTDRFLNGLNPSNPKVAAALKACQSKLPTFGSGDG
jgi:hypothetical protein